jgi:phage terminase large subunit-like protein
VDEIQRIIREDEKWCKEIGATYEAAAESVATQTGLVRDLNWNTEVFIAGEGVKGDKRQRASMWARRQHAGKVCLRRAAWNGKFTGEADVFDGLGLTHDDQVDAASGAFAKLYLRRGAEVDKKKTPELGTYEYIKELQRLNKRR